MSSALGWPGAPAAGPPWLSAVAPAHQQGGTQHSQEEPGAVKARAVEPVFLQTTASSVRIHGLQYNRNGTMFTHVALAPGPSRAAAVLGAHLAP